jgi:hypothetical protein
MKTILLTFATLLLFMTASQAKVISNQEADTYYKNCLSQKMDPRVTADSQKSICACTSAQMVKNMTVEDVQTMRGNDQAARNAINKMLVDVYAPCMSDIVRDLLTTQCRSNPQISGANAGQICDCFAKLTGDWYSLSGRTIMAEALKKNPNLTDPTAAIQESALFQSESMKNLQSCMKEP